MRDFPHASRTRVALALAAVMISAPAFADPCKAIPDRGPMPAFLTKGRTFSGPISYVGDGDSLCVDVGGRNRPPPRLLDRRGIVPPSGPENDPRTDHLSWVEVRVADFYSPELHASGGREAKATLERLAKGRYAVCKAQHRSHDRVVAVCRIGGVSVGELMRLAGVREGGNR